MTWTTLRVCRAARSQPTMKYPSHRPCGHSQPGLYYSHGNVHHSYSKELIRSWSRSVWLFCLDITYGQSLRDTYSIKLLSDWTMCTWSDICVHGLNMTRCIEQYKSQLQADQSLASCDWFIRHRSLAPALAKRFHCSHVWVWVMHDGSVDVRVIQQYRRWSLSRNCHQYTHVNNILYTQWDHLFTNNAYTLRKQEHKLYKVLCKLPIMWNNGYQE